MDWKIISSTFILIFLAELGDKTQLATLSFAAKTGSPLAVFIGAGGALLVTTLIAVVFGGAITAVLPTRYIKYISGIIFIAFGVLVLKGS